MDKDKETIGVVDRFEGDFVIIEIEGVTQDIPRISVAAGVEPGDVVRWQHPLWIKDEALTAARTKEIKELMDELWED